MRLYNHDIIIIIINDPGAREVHSRESFHRLSVQLNRVTNDRDIILRSNEAGKTEQGTRFSPLAI